MKTLRKNAARSVALLAMAGALSVTVPQTATAASDYLNPCDLSTKIQELQDWGSDKSNNIVVYKDSAHKSSNFNNVVARGKTTAKPCKQVFGTATYHWVVFKGSGKFTRKGDGGYRNWAFYGKFTRNDNVVTFHRR
ncbi:hypothetical protein QNO07_05640 [Streptomyces sp. 549]|uniref:hypothetical protein n=1 Tax=Streptomyces sp. 549 TaxID=3049076 RepID=UPI0024C26EFC|nr:hypothetical protein [Streptomyces sp. 549]MDK1472918.1 hypothetical protein [Streptomyces sp. 549]